MRDLLLVSIVAAGCFWGLKRPWIALLVWVWLSIMNPHRYTFGFAFSAPLAQMAALSILLGLMFSQDRRESPFRGAPTNWFIALTIWITISWAMGLDPSGDLGQWTKVMKINVMVVVALVLVHSKQQIMGLTAVLVASIGLLALKGGLFTLTTGGGGRVWGPPGSFIADNNEFACAVVMTIPLIYFLYQQAQTTWIRRGFMASMVVAAAAALGSQSRGAFLAITAMALFLWWKGRSKVKLGLVLLLAGVLLVLFMPDSWTQRMESIDNYQEDRSAMGRISAWWVSWGIGLNYIFGVGFSIVRPELFAQYSPYPTMLFVAHSIYFQMLGHHGWIGLVLFLGVWFSTWRIAGQMIREGRAGADTAWVADLGAMVQVSLVAYMVGGAFLSLAYFDLPYYIMAVTVCARQWLLDPARRKEAAVPEWQRRLGWGPGSRHAQGAG